MSIVNHIIRANPVGLAFNWIFKHLQILSDISQYICSLIFSKASIGLRSSLFLLGLGSITWKVGYTFYKQLKFWSFLPQHLRNEKNFNPTLFKQKYGNCYVLITGAADGIGYAYAREFAKMGFDLIMADIQESKLKARRESILHEYPNIRIESFVVDMSNPDKIKEFIN